MPCLPLRTRISLEIVRELPVPPSPNTTNVLIFSTTAIRQLGLEFLVTLAEQRPGMVRKIPNFVQNLVPVVLNFMMDLEEEWDQEDVRVFPLPSLSFAEGLKLTIYCAFCFVG